MDRDETGGGPRFAPVSGVALLCAALSGGAAFGDGAWTAKIGFDPRRVDASGLYGPPGGRRALDYEFCIPDSADLRLRVEAIDPSLHFSTSPGRIGCGDGELLAIGNSRQQGFHGILEQLARLPFVVRIEPAWFE